MINFGTKACRLWAKLVACLIMLTFNAESNGKRIETDGSDVTVGLYIGCLSDVTDFYLSENLKTPCGHFCSEPSYLKVTHEC